ncbi:hypothetical protein VP1G_05392 [Cytospora mali]|uniref:Magnesium transport protein CorA n=1 Tax=Cytospora mali TaxID=578113 RepID=A0A194V2B4_CYTMA|nr:hypothetical protein VP1G_05392 [Valsa mali var. pyri (nom. inval.)]
MEDHDILPTCLSAERHKPQDYILHYMGCEQYFQREEYLASLSTEQVTQVEAKLRRIQYVRTALKNDAVEGRRLVHNLSNSFRRWRSTKEFEEGINRVRELRTMHFALNGNTQKDARTTNRCRRAEYDPDIDANAYVMRFKNGRLVRNIDDKRFHEQWPCHRISVDDLINGEVENNPMIPPENTINYIHFPANNMSWAEKAITKYFKQATDTSYVPPLDRFPLTPSSEVLPPDCMLPGRRLLGPRYWKSQQQSSCVTGKYMGPMCEAISVHTGDDEVKDSIALFMPYLNWDTARHQFKINQAIQKENERHKVERSNIESKLGGPRVRQRGLQMLNAHSKQPNSAFRLENRTKSVEKPNNGEIPKPPARSATGAFASIMKRHGRFGKLPLWSAFITDEAGRIIAGTEVGQVLFDAAMMYEAMLTYQERSLIRKYMHNDLPLHPRRTLEQTNEWTLGLSWHASARDQVVHRATRPKQLDFQTVDPFTMEWSDRIRKLPRLMMIDQLWMWVIDDQTIITCFPDHGDLNGYCHLDVPGVHQNVRNAIVKYGTSRIQSVFDLAVIILGEVQVSRASMRGVNLGPDEDYIHFMQIFRQAIRDVASKHSFGAEQYWEWARIFSRLAHTDINSGLSDLIVPFLDIGKEGELQGQIKSIVRDLDIMLRISIEQKDMLERFEKAVGNISRSINPVDMEPIYAELKANIENLEDMQKSAGDISASLDYLISLKQQQVTVVQAWQAMKQGDDTQKQNVTLLVFTVVTVVFLPMSFISSVFGMNNKEIAGRDSPMTLADQFKWMIPLSFGIVAITYYMAFGSPTKMTRNAFRWVYIKFGMYRFFTPTDITLAAAMKKLRGRMRRKEVAQEWERRRSEQMSKDAQDRRAATRRGAVIEQRQASETIRPGTPVKARPNGERQTSEPAPPDSQVKGQHSDHIAQSGMFAMYQRMNSFAGKKRTTTDDMV